MVLPLRFPPGMAGGLLLAYPRTKKAGSLRLMALGERNFLAFIHSRADLVNFGERDFRHGQPFAAFRVDEIDIPQLPALQQTGAAGLQEFLPGEATVGIVSARPAPFEAWWDWPTAPFYAAAYRPAGYTAPHWA